ncbi:MAG: hypothetical protein IT484_02410 [Gammaproteobacteria bacterium]|nr:hypothetical protein [Gammaproteobacteria bacterium]
MSGIILAGSIVILAVALAVAWTLARRRRKRRQSSKACQWSIGILSGRDPLALQEHPDHPNPRFTVADIPGNQYLMVADPFLVQDEGRWLLFFEMLNRGSRLGEIGVATSSDGWHWSHAGTALREPFHLSYPQVFRHAGGYFMIPESRKAREVRLYRALDFPLRWTLDRVLFTGNYSDPTILSWQDRWWIFATRHPRGMEIWSADELRGEWRPHPGNPVYRYHKSAARNGGRPVVADGRILRFAQDARGGYGNALRAFAIDVLDEARFREHPLEPDPFLAPHGNGWACAAMHHCSPVLTASGTWLAAVDGCGLWDRAAQAGDAAALSASGHRSDTPG